MVQVCNGRTKRISTSVTLTRPLLLTGTLEVGRNVLWRHQDDQRLAKVSRYVLKHERVVRIDDDEQRSSRVRIQVARIQTVWLLVAGARFAAQYDSTLGAVALYTGGQASQFVAICRREGLGFAHKN